MVGDGHDHDATLLGGESVEKVRPAMQPRRAIGIAHSTTLPVAPTAAINGFDDRHQPTSADYRKPVQLSADRRDSATAVETACSARCSHRGFDEATNQLRERRTHAPARASARHF